MSELDILLRFKHGDSNAFKVLYERYFEVAYFYVLSHVNDRLDAEDIVEELFLNIWEKRESIVIKKSFKYYLLKSAHNRVINYFKSSKTKIQKEFETLDEEVQLFTEADYKDVSDNYLLTQELREHIVIAVNKLPIKCRRIFKLSRQYNLNYSQIADKLGVSINTVEKQISIALAKLRKELKDFLH